MSPAEYCREIESYLCRRNEGHLVRIVGPAFDLVRGWAEQGIPLKVAMRGIDRRVERAEARPSRRRPIRIEFCEADVLEAFDEWRRMVGVGVVGPATGENGSARLRRRSLPAHLARVLPRLVALQASRVDPGLQEAAGRTVRSVEALAHGAAAARGRAREELLQRLRALDAELTDAAFHTLSPEAREALSREAAAELASYRDRMPDPAWHEAHAAATARLLRDRLEIPTIAFE